MKPTNEELRAAIEWGMKLCNKQEDAQEAGAILRAHLETFDEERAFLEAAMEFAQHIVDFNQEKSLPRYYASDEKCSSDFTTAYRSLVAKREGK